MESPVHSERCTPGSGEGAVETSAGDRGLGATAPPSLCQVHQRASEKQVAEWRELRRKAKAA